MNSDRSLWCRLFSSLVLIGGVVAGCGGGDIRVCENESEAMLSDGTVRRQSFQSVSDRSEGGVLAGEAPEGPGRPRQMILLLDYSASMFGGYGRARVPGCNLCAGGLAADGRPSRRTGGALQPYYFETAEFQGLLARWLDAATPPGTAIGLEVLLFNARVWRLGEAGPELFHDADQLDFRLPVSSASVDQIADWLAAIPGDPRTVDRSAPNTTESSKALRAVVDAIRGEAIVWLVTDNIVDTGGGTVSADDARRNLEFYQTLKAEPRVQMASAYPLFLPEACSWMCGTTLFAYGIYVSHFERPSSAEFHRLGGTRPSTPDPQPDGLLWNAALRDLAAEYGSREAVQGVDLSGVPLRLKPIDTEVLALDFELYLGQALKCDAKAEYNQEVSCLATVTVRNTLRHQSVDSAKLSFRNGVLLPRKERQRRRLPWASAVCEGEMRTLRWEVRGGRSGNGSEPIEIGPLEPLQETVVTVLFRLPAIHVDTRSHAYLADVALTNRFLLDGRVSAEISDIHTRLFIDTEGLENVYGASELPAMFREQEQSRIRAEYPAGAVISNNGQLLGIAILLGGGTLAALASLLAVRFQRVHYTVVIDGMESVRLSIPRLSSRKLEIDGRVRARVIRGWGPSCRLLPSAGCHLRKDGAAWLLETGDDQEGYRIEIKRGWTRAPGRDEAKSDNW